MIACQVDKTTLEFEDYLLKKMQEFQSKLANETKSESFINVARSYEGRDHPDSSIDLIPLSRPIQAFVGDKYSHLAICSRLMESPCIV